MGDEVEFLPADKHKSFLQDGSITLHIISQTGPKYQKQSVSNIFAISQGKHEGWSWFFDCWQMLKLFANRYNRFRFVRPGMPKLLKTTSLLFLYNILKKKEVSDTVDFLHADKQENRLQIDTKIFWWVWSSIPKVPKKAILKCLYNISKKFRDKFDFSWCK